jgi:hypothetical protein
MGQHPSAMRRWGIMLPLIGTQAFQLTMSKAGAGTIEWSPIKW